jgi:hypothetical protein
MSVGFIDCHAERNADSAFLLFFSVSTALKFLRSYFVIFAMKTEYGSIGKTANIPFTCL